MAGVPVSSDHPTRPGRGQERRPAGARWAAALAAGLLIGPLLAGCGGAGDERSVADDAAQSLATADRAALRQGGRATWAVDGLPETLNVYQHGADEVSERVAAATLPMLFTRDGAGRPEANPDYLRSAEITATEPRQQVLYTLNPEATWSDGEPLDAADFVAQWRALDGTDRAYWSASAQGYERIEEITEGPEPHQVEVTFTRPYAEWRSLFSPLYPAEATGDPEVFNEGLRRELPVTAGPFQVRSVNEEEQSLTLARDERWWGDPALLDELVLTAVPRAERGAALVAGEVDIAEVRPEDAARIDAAATEENGADDGNGATEGNGADGDGVGDGKGEGLGEGEFAEDLTSGPASAVDALHEMALARLHPTPENAAADQRYAAAVLRADQTRERTFATREEALREQLRGFTVHRAYHPSATQLTLNGSSELLKDEQVRWAIARALDREKLAREVHGPAGLPSQPLGSHLRVVGQEEYQDTSEALGEPGAERAAELLTERGWRLPAAGAAGDDKAAAAGPAGGSPGPLSVLVPAAQQRAGLLHQAARLLTDAATPGAAAVDAERAAEDEGAEGDGAAGPAEEAARETAAGEDAGTPDESRADEELLDAVQGAPAAPREPAPTDDERPAHEVELSTDPAAPETDRAAALPAGGTVVTPAAHAPAADEPDEPDEPEERDEPDDAAGAAARLAEEAAGEAAELRAAAGTPVRVRDGEPLSLRFVLPDGADAEPLRRVGQRIAAMLAAVGIGTEITEVPAAEYFDDHIAAGAFDLALYSWPASAFPATDAKPLFTKPQSIPGGRLLIEQNYTRLGTDHIDQLLDRAAGALDAAEYHEQLTEADARIWAAGGSLPLFQRPQLMAVRSDLAGVGAFGLATPRFQDIGFRR